MDNKTEICKLFSRYGTLAIQISGKENEAREAIISIGDVNFSVPLKPVFGFTTETKFLRETLEKEFNARVQTQILAPGKIRLKLLSD